MMNWNDLLVLPEASLQGDKRIPWSVLSDQGELKKRESNVVRKTFREIQAFAVLNHSNTRMQAVVDDDYNIQSIIFLTGVITTDRSKIAEASRILHACFPNPTVLLGRTSMEEFRYISVGLRRNSRAKHGAFVTEKVQASGFFRTADPLYTPYFEAIAYDRLPQATLLAYVAAMGDRTQMASVIPTLGFYPTCKEGMSHRLLDLASEVNELSAGIKSMDERRVSWQTSLAESAKICEEMHKLEEKKQRIIQEIAEVCE